MHITSHFRTLAGVALLLAAGSAAAQYVWVDANGKRTYSDRPPPPDVTAARILHAPKGMQQIMAVNTRPADAAVSAPVTMTVAQREEDYQKRRKDSAEKHQKAQADADLAAERKRNCDNAQRNKAQLESGSRLQSPTATDRHEVMGEAERAAELARANKALAACR